MAVVLSRLDGVQKLADYQQRCITGIVMYIFQSAVLYILAAVFQKLCLISMPGEDSRNHFKMHRQHGRNQGRYEGPAPVQRNYPDQGKHGETELREEMGRCI